MWCVEWGWSRGEVEESGEGEWWRRRRRRDRLREEPAHDVGAAHVARQLDDQPALGRAHALRGAAQLLGVEAVLWTQKCEGKCEQR